MPFSLKDMLLGAVSVPELAYFESENTLFFLFFFFLNIFLTNRWVLLPERFSIDSALKESCPSLTICSYVLKGEFIYKIHLWKFLCR